MKVELQRIAICNTKKGKEVSFEKTQKEILKPAMKKVDLKIGPFTSHKKMKRIYQVLTKWNTRNHNFYTQSI